ncbi:hypothetical protein POM88_053646 [Heracleum sosnowskyi]|uniref:Uncharacterized protein n=1 Tax=Heracleum sosnowskyi TaxID=360622 RepID=A0AAD8LXF3_9APIA|nr:hypothetical protein POM88_053646 [Heracleum sosnowskyi]
MTEYVFMQKNDQASNAAPPESHKKKKAKVASKENNTMPNSNSEEARSNPNGEEINIQKVQGYSQGGIFTSYSQPARMENITLGIQPQRFMVRGQYVTTLKQIEAEANARKAQMSSRPPWRHLPKRLFKVYSEFGRQINVHVPPFMDQKTDPQWFDWRIESPYWTSESSEYPESTTTVYAHLLPNESHNFMAIILCFQRQKFVLKNIQYSVKNTTSGFIWSSCYRDLSSYGSVMVIVPKSIFSVTDDDHRIELTIADDRVEMLGIHLLYNTETETIEDVAENHVITSMH